MGQEKCCCYCEGHRIGSVCEERHCWTLLNHLSRDNESVGTFPKTPFIAASLVCSMPKHVLQDPAAEICSTATTCIAPAAVGADPHAVGGGLSFVTWRFWQMRRSQLWGALRPRTTVKIRACNNIYTDIARRLFSEVCLTCIRKSGQWEKMLPEGAEREWTALIFPLLTQSFFMAYTAI